MTRFLTTRNPGNLVSPWRDMEEFSNRISRIFDDSATSVGAWRPAVNVEETQDELLLTAELPGMTTDDLEIDLENNVLTIRGEKRTSAEEASEDKKVHVWERRYGAFQRSFAVPRTVDADGIEAHFRDGILHVHMPKAPEAKGRRIEVKTES